MESRLTEYQLTITRLIMGTSIIGNFGHGPL